MPCWIWCPSKPNNTKTASTAELVGYLLPTHNNERIPLIHRLPLRYLHFFDGSGDGGSQVVFHLHRLENGDGLAAFHFCAWLEGDAQHESGHGGAHDGLARFVARFDGAGERLFALVLDMHLKSLPGHHDFVPRAARIRFGNLSRVDLV